MSTTRILEPHAAFSYLRVLSSVMSTNPEMTTTIQALKPSTQSTLKPDFRVYRSPQTNDNVATSVFIHIIVNPSDAHDCVDDVPEAFFTPSTADLKMAQASLSAKTQALTNAPLRTQAMRDAELRAKLAKYPEVRGHSCSCRHS